MNNMRRRTCDIAVFGAAVSVFVLAVTMLLLRGDSCAFAEDLLKPGAEVTLDAEKVTFDEAGGTATAEGGVLLRYGTLRISAEHVDVDAGTNVVTARSLPGKKIVIVSQGKTLEGDQLRYNLKTREGVLLNATAYAPAGEGALFIRGKNVEVAPPEIAVQKGWVSKEAAASAIKDGETVGKWESASFSTCPLDHPHYRLVTRRVTLIPGKKVIARNPRIYIGDTLLFSYPFDYIVRLDRKERAVEATFMPLVERTSDKGVGLGISGPIAWDTGKVTIDAMYWEKINEEWKLSLEQNVGETLTLFATTSYTWEETTKEKTYRPTWGLFTRSGDWKAKLIWSQREAVEVEKSVGVTYKSVLWRDPEFSIVGPWWQDKVLDWSWWRVKATAGRYEENSGGTTIHAERKGAGIELYGESEGDIRAFWNGSYWYYRYDDPYDAQKIGEATVGFRYGRGTVSFGTAYVRRWVSGESPMYWDSYEEREEIHQLVDVSLSSAWAFSLRGGYDLANSTMGELVYRLTYRNNCCMEWEFVYRDDRKGDDDWMGLRLTLTAFPGKPVSFGSKNLNDPFDRPKDAPVRDDD